MTDREKLMIWLEKCYGICNEDTECDECPFFTLNEGGCTSRLREVLTRELLKEQEPVAPTVDEELEDKNLFKCVCGGSLGIKGIFRYCPWCGKKVLWDG